jgi:hypothetical protein
VLSCSVAINVSLSANEGLAVVRGSAKQQG